MKTVGPHRIQEFYDELTSTLTYVVFHHESRDAVIIDSVLDYDAASGEYWLSSCKEVASFVAKYDLIVHYILETHAHADHLSGSQYLKDLYPNALVGIGKGIVAVQQVFKELLCLDVQEDGSQFDILFADEQSIKAGALNFTVRFTPGHTPACTTLCFEGFAFTGDALFMPDYGTGRCDFPKGSASDLYDSIEKKIYTLADETLLFVGHDYCPGGRKLAFFTTVAESKRDNIRLNSQVSKEEFVGFRSARDAGLATPKLLIPSIQVNIDAGKLPRADSQGRAFLKVPLIKRDRK